MFRSRYGYILGNRRSKGKTQGSSTHRVRIKYGPLKGVEGIIIRKNGGFRLVLRVTSIEQAMSINIDEALVEPVDIKLAA